MHTEFELENVERKHRWRDFGRILKDNIKIDPKDIV
jgi:hypothetical protein